MKTFFSHFLAFLIGAILSGAIAFFIISNIFTHQLFAAINEGNQHARLIESGKADISLRLYNDALTYQIPLTEEFRSHFWVINDAWYDEVLSKAKARAINFDTGRSGANK